MGVAIRQLRGSGSTTPYSLRTAGRKEGILGFPPLSPCEGVCCVVWHIADTRRDGRRETGTTGVEETDVIVLRIRASRHAGSVKKR